jgi:hypothetical protein
MEALLNSIWLVVALGLFAIWRTHWLPAFQTRRRDFAVRTSFLALVCALALLFPAISLSDDLHPELVGLPATKSSLVMAHSTASSRVDLQGLPASHFGVFGLPAAPVRLLPLLVAEGLVAVFSIRRLVAFAVVPGASRAPPSPLLVS